MLGSESRRGSIVPAGVVLDRRTYVFHELARDATHLAGWRRNTAALVPALRLAAYLGSSGSSP